ncbi:MAG TPA: hypothetical protein VGA80_14175 [Flavobacteriaceae bacterium]
MKEDSPVEIVFDEFNVDLMLNHQIENIRENVFQGRIVILKHVFTEQEMLQLKKGIIQWGTETPVFPHGESPSKYPSLNYHRIDDGSVPSVCPHIFHQYGFNTINELKTELSIPMLKIVNKLVKIQNDIAETNFEISLKELRLKVLHYPEGGAFLAKHKHPMEPQKIGLILSLSKIGKDFKTGAVAFNTPDGYVNTVAHHDIGDVLLFRYDLEHEVTPVNPDKKKIDWLKPTGKWSVVLELRDTHALSHQK